MDTVDRTNTFAWNGSWHKAWHGENGDHEGPLQSPNGVYNAPGVAWHRTMNAAQWADEGEETNQPLDLLLTFGQPAAAVVEALYYDQSAWPGGGRLWHCDVPLDRDITRLLPQLRHRLTQICAEMTAAGTRENANAVWLVFTASAGSTTTQQTGSHAPMQSLAKAVVQLLEVVAWQQWQRTVTPRLVLLVEPDTHSRHLAAWQEALGDSCELPIYLIADQRARQSEQSPQSLWQSAAANTLGALLWLPKAEIHDTTAQQAPFHAIGTSCRDVSHVSLQRAIVCVVALQRIQELLPQLLRHATDGTRGKLPTQAATQTATQDRDFAALTTLFTTFMHDGETLPTLITPPAPIRLGQGQARGWRDTLRPTMTLRAFCRMDLRPQRLAQRGERQQWLAKQLATWEDAWQAVVTAQLTIVGAKQRDVAGASASDPATIRAVQQFILQRLATLDEWLHTLGEETVATEQAVQALCDGLDRYCAALPTWSFAGLWQLISTPNQWSSWGWHLLIGLPHRLRRLKRALQAREEAIYHEANGHVIRQLGLAVLLDIQSHIAFLKKLEQLLPAMTNYLEMELTAALQQLPYPWQRQEIVALGQAWYNSRGPDLATEPLTWPTLTALDDMAGMPSSEWHNPAPGIADGAAVAETLLEHLSFRYQPPTDWQMLDWLAATVAAEDATTDGERAPADTWLAMLNREADPGSFHTEQVWSGTEVVADDGWLVIPHQERAENGFWTTDDQPFALCRDAHGKDLTLFEAQTDKLWFIRRIMLK